MRRGTSDGRFIVNDKACPSLHCAIAYGMHAVGRDGAPTTLYVREVAKQDALRVIERHPDKSVTLRKP